jgi:LPXTG-site transpeptidase (sortase) family protein
MNRALDSFLIFLGIVFLALGIVLVRERYIPRPIPPQVYAPSKYPTKIQIPTIGVELPIIPSLFVDNSYQTTKDGVSYLTTSPIPGTPGNSVMYGHNWPNLLGDLHRVKPGDHIIVTQGEKQTTFTVIFTSVVHPNETHIQQNSPDTRLTLYTCTGLFDTKRFVVTAVAETETTTPIPQKSV